jgi:AI-2 transport protein TqsA
MTERQTRILLVLLSIIVVILAGAALRATRLVSMPLAFAFFLAVLVWPIHCGIQRRVPGRLWWMGVVGSMLVLMSGLAFFAGGVWLVAYQVASDEQRLEQLGAQWQAQWEEASAWLDRFGLSMPEDEVLTYLVNWAGIVAQSVTGLIVGFVLIFFFVLLMLVEADHWREKSEKAMTDAHANAVLDAVSAITHQVRTFLVTQAFVAALTAGVTALWLWIMDVPFVLLWTLLTFLLDFVPNIGPTIAGLLITLVALATLGWGAALVTGLGVLAIQQFFGSYVNPLLMGHRLMISPLVVLLSVVFWAWVWGPAGAIIAVPISATLIIACAHVPALRPVALMLGRTADEREFMKQTHANENDRRAGHR